MNKVRCKNCRGYFDRTEAVWFNSVSHICSEPCMNEFLAAQKARKNTPRMATRTPRKPRAPREQKVPVEMRFEVKERDGCCRWCGDRGTQCHHIIYRAQGGPAVLHNLISLCAQCHARAHSSKETYQSVLLAYIWILYVEGRRLTIPQCARDLESRGLLSEQQRARFHTAEDLGLDQERRGA